MSEMLRLMSVDRNELRLALEDMRARANNWLTLLEQETATKASLAKELRMANDEINCLEAERDELQARIRELEES